LSYDKKEINEMGLLNDGLNSGVVLEQGFTVFNLDHLVYRFAFYSGWLFNEGDR